MFGGVEVRALLIKVALHHGDRWRRVAANLSRDEGGPSGEVLVGVDGAAPGGQDGGEEGGVKERDVIGDVCGGGWEKGVGLEEGWNCWRGWRRCLHRSVQVQRPEMSDGRPMAEENGRAV